MTLLNTPGILKLESRFISLFERTFLKSVRGKHASKYLQSVKTQFSSVTFRVQIDKIIDDIYLHTIDYTDSQLDEQISASTKRKRNKVKVFASASPLPLTVEAVKQSVGLSEEITKSIIRMLKDEGIYELHPSQLEKRIRDLWGGQKHRAVRFARTFTADVATNTTLWRYQDAGIEEMQFYAKIDERTSDQCRMLHGTIFRTNSPEARRYKIPLHFHCRSDIIPVPITMKVDDKMRFQNRDFSKQMDQDFNHLSDKVDNDLVKKTFSDIESFRGKYGIDQFILDEDIEARLQKLSVQVLSEVPKAKVPKAKTPKLSKNEVKVQKLQDEIKDIEKEREELIKEMDLLTKKLDEIGYDPKDKVKYKLYNETEDKIYKLDNKDYKLKDLIDGKNREIRKLKEIIIKDQLEKEKKKKEKEFLENIPKSTHPKAKEVMDKIEQSYKNREEKIESIVKQRLALRDKRYDFGEACTKEYNDYVKAVNSGKISKELFNKEISRLNKEWNKIHEIDDEIEKLVKLQDEVHTLTNEDIREMLYINDGEASTQFIRLGTENEVFRGQQAEEMLEFFNKALTKELREKLPEIDIVELGKGGRAFTRNGANKIWLGYEDSTDVLIHEIGHNLEHYHPYVRESAYRQLTTRTKGETAEKLRDITGIRGYEDDEIAKKDKFFDPYLGKIYGGTKSTEITSMAIQYLYKDPVYLYKNDPETFEWIVNVIRGHYL